MANNDLAVRFTETNYATKNEVSKELKISVIDGVWDKILSYRSLFYHYLPIKGVDKNQLRICLCPTISNRISSSEAKLVRLVNEYLQLDRVSGDAQYFELTNLVKALQNVAAAGNYVSDEEVVKAVINGSKEEKGLSNYHNALKYVKNHYKDPINDNYLAELYSKVTGIDELTYFYRDCDYEDSGMKLIIGRVYKSAPHEFIEGMMNSLFNFVEKSTLSPLCKALVSFYYIEFVKPFKNYNDEIASLFAKSVLAHESLGDFGVYLPTEVLLNENENEVNRLFYEVQVTSDITYYLSFALAAVDKLLDRSLDYLADYSAKIIKNDFFKVDEPVKQEEPIKEEVKIVVKEVVAEKPIEQYVKPVEVKAREIKKEVKEVVNKPQGLAVNFIPEELDEKTATRLERHLMELDVRLSKGQAKFYARHCTLGMYYTIEQYRKLNRCVYETARTSMDKLVEYGYYEKGSAGKKFVYTPKKK